MDNKNYNEYLTTLFQNCSIQMYLKGNTSNIKNEIQRMFKELSDVYNKTIAVDFLSQLKHQYPTLLEKIEHYPEMLWKTSIADEIIRNDLVELVRDKLLTLYEENAEAQHYDARKKEEYIVKTMDAEMDLLTDLKKIGIALAENKSDPLEIAFKIRPALQDLAGIAQAFTGDFAQESLERLIKMHHIMDGGNIAKLPVDPIELNEAFLSHITFAFEEMKRFSPEKFKLNNM